MDREGTSRSVFDDQDDKNEFFTKLHHFELQRAMNETNNTLNERLEHLATEVCQYEARRRDNPDAKLDAQMDCIEDMLTKRKPSSFYSSSRRRSSGLPSKRLSGASTPRCRKREHVDREDYQALNPFHGNGLQGRFLERDRRQHDAQEHQDAFHRQMRQEEEWHRKQEERHCQDEDREPHGQ